MSDTKALLEAITGCREDVKRLREQQVPKSEIDEKIAKVATAVEDIQKKIKEDVKRPSQGDPVKGASELNKLGIKSVRDFDVTEGDNKRHGLQYTTRKSGTLGQITGDKAISEDAVAALQTIDEMYIVDQIMARKHGGPTPYMLLKQRHGGDRAFYEARAKSSNGLFRNLFDRYDRLTSDLAGFSEKALSSTGSTAGDEWVPTGFGSSLLEIIRLNTPVAGMLPVLSMPTNPFINPVQSTAGTAYIRTENTAVTEGTMATTNRTWTAYTFANYQAFSDELTEDSAVAVVPAVQADIVRALSEGLELALVCGDSDGAGHFDEDLDHASTATTRTFNAAFSGLRQLSLDAATITVDGGGGFLTANTVAAAYGGMDKFGAHRPAECVLLVNAESYLKLVTETGSDLRTVDKYGGQATILTGELGRIFGIPVMTSFGIEFRRNAVGTGGINTTGTAGSSTDIYSVALLLNRMNFKLGDRRDVRFETDKDITAGKNQMVATARWGFAPVEVPSSTSRSVVSIVNLD